MLVYRNSPALRQQVSFTIRGDVLKKLDEQIGANLSRSRTVELILADFLKQESKNGKNSRTANSAKVKPSDERGDLQ